MGRKKKSNIGNYQQEILLANNAEEKLKQINALQVKVNRREKRLQLLEAKSKSLDKRVRAFSKLSPSLVSGRKNKPTIPTMNTKIKQSRRKETWELCHAIHGGNENDPEPTLFGLFDTFVVKQKVGDTIKRIILHPPLRKALTKEFVYNEKKEFFKSTMNKHRSLNVYYSHNVMGKRKYIALRKSYKCGNGSNFIKYSDLSAFINSIGIGVLKDINDFNDTDVPCKGFYRDLPTYALRLVEFYLRVNVGRVDKLQFFDSEKKDPRAKVFLLSIGGDGAPLVGTLFLVSFLNVVKRIASSSNNFLICGTDEKEKSPVVKAYVQKLAKDLAYLESKTFELVVDGSLHLVEFKVELLPNDMSMLCFLGGELSNAAHYFTTFANVNHADSDNLKKTFSMDGSSSWKPWHYEDRLKVIPKVNKKKEELSGMKDEVKARTKLTKYIGKELKSRQEFPPLIGKYIDLARCDPLHLKNNVTEDLFKRILSIVLATASLPNTIRLYHDVPNGNILKVFVNLIKTLMNCNQLAGKIKSWFDGNTKSPKPSSFDCRFRGKESFNFINKFQVLFSKLLPYIQSSDLKNFHVLFYLFVQVRHSVSISARIDIDTAILNQLFHISRNLFCASAVYDDGSFSPSLWVMCNVVPHYARDIYSRFNYGLGLNVMEGREQKNQTVKKYSENTTVQNKWVGIFRHDFMQLIYLKEQGFDEKIYKKKLRSYYPDSGNDLCQDCYLLLVSGKCEFCSSEIMLDIINSVKKYS